MKAKEFRKMITTISITMGLVLSLAGCGGSSKTNDTISFPLSGGLGTFTH
jgi:hypothetical protein